MKICIANLYYNEATAQSTPTAFLERVPMLKHLPVSLAAGGHQVHVLQLYPEDASFALADVGYQFIRPAALEKIWARAAGRLNGRTWTRHVPATGAARRILALEPDVVHFHGLTMNTSLRMLQMLRGKAGPAIVGQHHGGRPAEGSVSRNIQRRAMKQVQRALFGHESAAARFVDAGLLEKRQVVTIMDKSTPMTMASRPEARKESRMHGSPVFLWFANLDADRDPMTAIQGFEHILRSWSRAQLYVYYNGDALLTQLRAYVIARPSLAGHVHFRGRPPEGSPEAIFNSADFLFQTDRRANNGHAVLEAMACGVIPIVSDVPHFRSLVDNGRCGFLFPQGEAKAMARQVLKFSPGKIAGRAALVHNWFEYAYSYDALASILLEIYGEAIAERRVQNEPLGHTLTEARSN